MYDNFIFFFFFTLVSYASKQYLIDIKFVVCVPQRRWEKKCALNRCVPKVVAVSEHFASAPFLFSYLHSSLYRHVCHVSPLVWGGLLKEALRVPPIVSNGTWHKMNMDYVFGAKLRVYNIALRNVEGVVNIPDNRDRKAVDEIAQCGRSYCNCPRSFIYWGRL